MSKISSGSRIWTESIMMGSGLEKKPLFRVRTCATSANLGPGYDISALALDIFNECEVFSGSGKVHSIEYYGPYANDIDKRSGLVISSIKKIMEKFADRIKPPGNSQEMQSEEKPGDDEAQTNNMKKTGHIEKERQVDDRMLSSLDINMSVNIPPGKGLGSSASAVMAGLLIANRAYNMGLNKKELFQAAAEIESSPDNAAAALSGGMAVVYRDGEKYLFEKIDLSRDYRILLFMPSGTVNTEEARKLIPEKVYVQDAVNNISNFSLLVKYLEEGDLKGAAVFSKDYMYQKYRKAIYPASLALVKEIIETYSIPAFISGAGPAVTAILDEKMFSRFKDVKGKITANYLGFQNIITSISEGGSHYQ